MKLIDYPSTCKQNVILPKITQLTYLLPYPRFALFLPFFVVSLDVVVIVPMSFPTIATMSLSIGVVKASPYRKGRSTYKTSLGISKVLCCSRAA